MGGTKGEWEESASQNTREAVIVVSSGRSGGIGIDYGKETDKAPLTAASS